MDILIGLFVLFMVSVIFNNAKKSWSKALEPGNKIRADRKRARK